MRRLLYPIIIWATAIGIAACDDDSFSTSASNLLSFSTDTVRLDTIFSTLPTATQSLWAYNRSDDGIRCTSIRLENGSQSGFRVNVDGTYLGPTSGYKIADVDIRKGDSIRIFVEATLSTQQEEGPQQAEDRLVFTLESGVEQSVSLNAFAWNADILHNITVSSDSTISSSRPIVVFGGIKVKQGATLTIAAGSDIYFRNEAGIDVEGTLICRGTAQNGITLRGDRLDDMFDYLPYDRVSGNWQGIHLASSSYNNVIDYTDLHSPYNGIVADSAATEQIKLQISNSIVHNCQGDGLYIANGTVLAENCQITNTLGDCFRIDGGNALVNNCTIAQFYPFDSARGYALNISNNKGALNGFACANTIITGYADDVINGSRDKNDSTKTFAFQFEDCILRTPRITEADSVYYTRVVFEDVEDTVSTGKKMFVEVDADLQRYDFHLAPESAAIGLANAATSLPNDRDGQQRDGQPDLGCYEYIGSEASAIRKQKNLSDLKTNVKPWKR